MNESDFASEYEDVLSGTTRPGTWGAFRKAEPSRYVDYSIIAHLGRGGFGDVFLAINEDNGATVAIKVLRFDRFDQNAQDALLEEFATLKTLHNRRQHLVEATDGGYLVSSSGNPRAFIAMEFVQGGTLRQMLRTWRRLPQLEAIRIAIEIGRGLQQLHENTPKILHRDIKPENVLFDTMQNGNIRLADFGLAIAVPAVSSGVAAGTLEYMAPEIFDGRRPSISSDIYSYGCVIYEMLCGNRPISLLPTSLPPGSGDQTVLLDPARLERLRHEIPPMPHLVKPGIDANLSELVISMLDKRPLNRPARVSMIVESLERLEVSEFLNPELQKSFHWPRPSSPSVHAGLKLFGATRMRLPAMWMNTKAGLLCGLLARVQMSVDVQNHLDRMLTQIQFAIQSLHATWNSDFNGRGGEEAMRTIESICKEFSTFNDSCRRDLHDLPELKSFLEGWVIATNNLLSKCGSAIRSRNVRAFEQQLYRCRTSLIILQQSGVQMYTMATDRLLAELVQL